MSKRQRRIARKAFPKVARPQPIYTLLERSKYQPGMSGRIRAISRG